MANNQKMFESSAQPTEGTELTDEGVVSVSWWARIIIDALPKLSSRIPALQLLMYAADNDLISAQDGQVIYAVIQRSKLPDRVIDDSVPIAIKGPEESVIQLDHKGEVEDVE